MQGLSYVTVANFNLEINLLPTADNSKRVHYSAKSPFRTDRAGLYQFLKINS